MALARVEIQSRMRSEGCGRAAAPQGVCSASAVGFSFGDRSLGDVPPSKSLVEIDS